LTDNRPDATCDEPTSTARTREPDYHAMVPLSVAPMMDYTDRHFRRILRPLTRHTLFYTEMINANAIVRGGRLEQLAFDAEEHPVALQLGGDDPNTLAEASRIAEDLGYREINLNIGCPSDRVLKGRFGACLMAEPEHVGVMVQAIQARVQIPVTVKHRIGIDDIDQYEHMKNFVDVVSAAGCRSFIVHARKAWLKGLSPKQNRMVPPLRHDEVHRLKAERPDLYVATNGGIRTLDEARAHLDHVDSVMIGRAAYDTPWIFASADSAIFGAEQDPYETRRDFLEDTFAIFADHLSRGQRFHTLGRHLLGLYHGCANSRRWKQGLASLGQSSDPAVLADFRALVASMREELARHDAA